MARLTRSSAHSVKTVLLSSFLAICVTCLRAAKPVAAALNFSLNSDASVSLTCSRVSRMRQTVKGKAISAPITAVIAVSLASAKRKFHLSSTPSGYGVRTASVIT